MGRLGESVKDSCFECGAPATEEHHVVPRSRGGTRTVPLCDACHGKAHGDMGVMSRTGIAARRARGEFVCKVPYGYQIALDGVHIELNLAEQTIVGLAIDLRRNGASLRSIGSELERRNLRTRRGNERWNPSAVSALLWCRAANENGAQDVQRGADPLHRPAPIHAPKLLIEFNGETLTAHEWSKRSEIQDLGLRATTIDMRRRAGWSAEKTLTTPRLDRGDVPGWMKTKPRERNTR